MVEKFVAIGDSSLYAEYKGVNFMSDGTSGSGVENGGGQKAEKKSTRVGDKPGEKSGTSPESTPKQNNFIEGIRSLLNEQERHIGPPPIVPEKDAAEAALRIPKAPQISFSEASLGEEFISTMRDGKEVVAKPDELKQLRRTLLNDGRISPDKIDSMSDAEIVSAYQIFLQNVEIADPLDRDFEHPKSEPERVAEEALLKERVARVQSRDEEILTPEKVEELMTTDEMAQGGYGRDTLGAGRGSYTWVDELPDLGSLPDTTKPLIKQIITIANSDRDDEAKLTHFKRIEEQLLDVNSRDELSDVIYGQIENTLLRGMAAIEAEHELKNVGISEREFVRGQLKERELKDLYFERAKRNFEKLVDLEKSGVKPGEAEWEAAAIDIKRMEQLADLKGDIDHPKGYAEAFYIAKAAKEVLSQRRDDLNSTKDQRVKGELKNILRPEEGLLAKIDSKFTRVLNNMPEEDREELTRKIDSEGAVYFKQIIGGWGATVEQARAKMLGLLTEVDADGNIDPVKEWKILKAANSLDTAVGLRQLLDITPVWEDVPRQIEKIYSFIEATDLSAEELGSSINQVIGKIQGIPFDSEVTREVRDKLLKNLEAFRAFHILRITYEKESMHPEKLTHIFNEYFEGREEDTFEIFLSRFEKDSSGREFLLPRTNSDGQFLDKNGQVVSEMLDAEFEKVNVHDMAFRLYSEQLQDDRIKMNMIEALTRQKIGGEAGFSKDELSQIKKDAGYDERLMPARWKKGQWEAQLEKMRVFFRDQVQAKIDSNSKLSRLGVDDLWGRIPNGGIDVTYGLVSDWHKKQSLHGAFGSIEENDYKQLANDLGIRQLGDEEDGDFGKRLKKLFNGKTFLEVRREHIFERLEHELERKHLMVNTGLPGNDEYEPGSVDMDYLAESGFLKSVESNAHNFAWMTMWSNYDNIRIYSRDNANQYAKDDIFEKVVFHQATNIFYGRHIDHAWEFFDPSVENRGRAKHDDVNELFKQHLPGKHHYMFPQNSLMVRWSDHFMTAKQKDEVRLRTEELMKEWDFDNEKYHDEFFGWMKSVAVMDMVENGQFTLGQEASEVIFTHEGSSKEEIDKEKADAEKEKDINMSGLARSKKLRKFEMIDVFADRMKHLNFLSPGLFQDYLAGPNAKKFFGLLDKVKSFYSTRDARLYPFTTLGSRADQDVREHHNKRLFNKPDLISSLAEKELDEMLALDMMEKEQNVKEKRKLGFTKLKFGGSWGIPQYEEIKLPWIFGTTPFRRARQWLEDKRRVGWDSKFLLFAVLGAGFTAGTMELVKQVPKQVTSR